MVLRCLALVPPCWTSAELIARPFFWATRLNEIAKIYSKTVQISFNGFFNFATLGTVAPSAG